jgi:hypothetical protein
MKRIAELPLRRVAAVIARKLSRYKTRRTGPAGIDIDFKKFARRRIGRPTRLQRGIFAL